MELDLEPDPSLMVLAQSLLSLLLVEMMPVAALGKLPVVVVQEVLLALVAAEPGAEVMEVGLLVTPTELLLMVVER